MKAQPVREKLVIVGNGMASVRLCEELVGLGLTARFAITVIGAEPDAGYNRVLLSAHLAGEASLDELQLKTSGWYRANGIVLRLGGRVEALDRTGGTVTLADGEVLPFDRLVLATGSEPIRLPVPGADLPGVHVFRDLADARALAALAGEPVHVAVIGGGLLGLEAAYGLKRAGHAVTVVHLMDRLMERQLDRRSAEFLRRAIARKGIAVRLGASTQAVLGEDRVEGLAFADGTTIKADAVVFAAGIRPNVALGKAAGLPVQRGLVVDDAMEVADGIFALGECAEHRGVVYGLVEPAYAQASVLARRLAGETASYAGSVLATNLKVSGVNVFSVGEIEGGEGASSVTFEDVRRGDYRKLVFRGSQLAGAVLVGETADGLWYRDLVTQKTDIAAFRGDLIFGRAACPALTREAA